MDAVKFLKELKRICTTIDCPDGCPLYRKTSDQCLIEIPEYLEGVNLEEVVSAVEKWSAEHPLKTRLQDFLEKYPEAMLRGGLPLFLPYTVGYCGDTDEVACGYCMHCSRNDPEKCWNLPLEE